MQCPTVKRNRAAQNEATRPKRVVITLYVIIWECYWSLSL